MRTVYSIVFLDIDGTLINHRHEVSANTRRLLNRLERQGIPVVLCSARSPAGIETVQRQAGLNGPMACYGGSLILDRERSILSDEGFSGETALRFKQLVRERFPSLTSSAYIYNIWLVDNAEDPMVRRDAEKHRCEPVAGELASAVQTASHVHKMLCAGPPGEIARLEREASPLFPQLRLIRSDPEYLEILKEGMSKCTAVEKLQVHYHLRREEIVACGDQFVDLEMLQYAGLGIAMGNAPEQVKAAADRVTASNDEEGVYIALKNLRFSPPGLDENKEDSP